MGNFIKYLFQIILSPAKGWEDVAYDLNRNRVNVRSFYIHAFLPVIAICSAAAFIRLFYGMDFLLCLAHMIKSFVTLFLTYHLAVYIISWFMPRLVDSGERQGQDQRRLALEVMMSIAFIAIVVLAAYIIKVKLAILEFLPFYAIFIIWKGCGFLKIAPRQEGLFMIAASGAVLGPYYLLSFIFNALL